MKITIGRYYNGNSVIHRLDARVKLFATICFIVLIFMADTFLIQGFLMIPVCFAFIIATKKPFKLLSIAKSPLWIGIFLFIINTVLLKNDPDNPGSWEPLSWGIFTISEYVVLTTLNVTLRIYCIILIIIVLTLTTKPVLLTKALEFYFYPLKLIKMPVHIFITIITIALRFIPTLLDEAGRILKAQASRGVDFKTGSLKTKAKASITLIVPLFVSAFAKADDLANAMETRGYNPYSKRTSYRNWKVTVFDILSFIVIVGMVVIVSVVYSNVFEIPDWFGYVSVRA